MPTQKGLLEHKGTKDTPRRETEILQLRREIKTLNRQFKRASAVEKVDI